ncbi:MAG: rhomboid family intramembrane serine protease, partial [Acidobacteria bacterium]|nr:rhomboid family intramembrane serine protease [Acidobacteriota bacterium]
MGGGTILAGLIPTAQFATVVILTVNLGMFLVTMLATAKVGELNALVRYGAAFPAGVFGGQWWRLITAGFLHGGIMHIGFNMWALMDVGRHAEEVYGARRMLAIYLLANIGGFLLSMLRGTMLTVGTSAGLFGLIGAMIALGVTHKWSYGASAIKAFYVRCAIYGLLWGLLPFFRVDNAAHLGGLATGFVVAYAAGTPAQLPNLREKVWGAIAALLVALTGYAFLR